MVGTKKAFHKCLNEGLPPGDPDLCSVQPFSSNISWLPAKPTGRQAEEEHSSTWTRDQNGLSTHKMIACLELFMLLRNHVYPAYSNGRSGNYMRVWAGVSALNTQRAKFCRSKRHRLRYSSLVSPSVFATCYRWEHGQNTYAQSASVILSVKWSSYAHFIMLSGINEAKLIRCLANFVPLIKHSKINYRGEG